MKRQKVDDSEEKSEESIVTKTSFYGKKIQEQCRPYVIGTVNVRGAVVGQPRGRRINTQGRQMVRITPSRKYVEPGKSQWQDLEGQQFVLELIGMQNIILYIKLFLVEQ